MDVLKEKVVEQLRDLQMFIHRSILADFSKAHNPHMGQGRVLNILRLKEEMSQKDLTTLLGMSKQGAAELIAKLEKSEYITKEPSKQDKRVMLIKLTDKGRDMADDVNDKISQNFNVFDCLSEEELNNFSDYLTRLNLQFEEKFPNENFEQRRETLHKFMIKHAHHYHKHFHDHEHFHDFHHNKEGCLHHKKHDGKDANK